MVVNSSCGRVVSRRPQPSLALGKNKNGGATYGTPLVDQCTLILTPVTVWCHNATVCHPLPGLALLKGTAVGPARVGAQDWLVDLVLSPVPRVLSRTVAVLLYCCLGSSPYGAPV